VDDASIKLIVDEITPLLLGRAPGKIFQLSRAALAIDFGMRDAGYLFLNVEPAAPRLYLITRTVRELEKQSRPLAQFAQGLKKELSQTNLVAIEKEPHDRIVWFSFYGEDDLGKPKPRKLAVQLTGRSANLIILDDHNQIIQTLRPRPDSEKTGDMSLKSTAPPPPARPTELADLLVQERASPSAIADRYFTSLLAEKERAARIASARADLRKKILVQERLLARLEQDIRRHENPEQHKHIGDLLLANLSTALRQGKRVSLIDYFDDQAPRFDVEIDEAVSLPEEAARRFALYAKSKRAIDQIEKRVAAAGSRLRELEVERQSLEEKIATGDFPHISTASTQTNASAKPRGRQKQPERIPGARRYLSSDDFEILVGRAAQDNDNLTFKIAKPNDLWLHAADYGGSHVVVRNSTRKDIPQRTLIEAAQLAAYFSQAKQDPKVDVHYTQRKFVAKMKGAKPGLVRLQRFKNITVAPKEAGTRS